MKLTVTDDFGVQLEEVFSGLTLKTASGETMSICMRDTGFEFNYQGKWYFAKEGFVEPFNTSIRNNYLFDQKHDCCVDASNTDTGIVSCLNQITTNLYASDKF